MEYKRSIFMWFLVLTSLVAAACQELEPNLNSVDEAVESLETNEGTGQTIISVVASNKEDHEEDSDYTWENSSVVDITLSGTEILSESDEVTISNSIIKITNYGNYQFTGSLSNGQIIVDIDEDVVSSVSKLGKSSSGEDTGIVRLILNGVDISNSTTSPIFVSNSAKTILVLNSNTENYILDGSEYIFENTLEDEPNAALFSKDDLTLFGEGSLTIEGNYNDGIASKDGLIIRSGNIFINALDDGIRGKNYVVVRGGNIEVASGGDGIKSDNEEDDDSGYISLERGNIEIISDGDALTAQTDLMINDGTINIISGGGSDSYSSIISNKGIKSAANVVIEGGTFTINTADDAIHSNGAITINGGEFSILSGDDAIHADSTVEINNGSISISKSYEGIESAVIIINDGTIGINSSDDGLNVAGGNDGSGGRGGPGGGFSSSGDYYIYINGGYIAITSTGDGIDANGSIVMTGGDIIIHGPTADNNSAIDYDGSFKIAGGFLAAAGSSGMAQAPGSSSSQYLISFRSNTTRSSGTIFHIENSAGSNILTFKPSKNYQSVVFSSPSLIKGNSYKIYFGGSSTGTETDGVYYEGSYTGGSLYKTITLSNIVTSVN